MFEYLLGKIIVYGIDKLVSSTSNKTDDKILEVAKKATVYLAPLANNGISDSIAKEISNQVIRKVQG